MYIVKEVDRQEYRKQYYQDNRATIRSKARAKDAEKKDKKNRFPMFALNDGVDWMPLIHRECAKIFNPYFVKVE